MCVAPILTVFLDKKVNFTAVIATFMKCLKIRKKIYVKRGGGEINKNKCPKYALWGGRCMVGIKKLGCLGVLSRKTSKKPQKDESYQEGFRTDPYETFICVFLSDEMDCRTAWLGCPPPVHPVIVPKVHCNERAFVFQLYFLGTLRDLYFKSTLF